MLHINLETCSSTQTHLKDILQNDPNMKGKDLLVTTQKQTAGHGRGKNEWQHMESAIAMSCTLNAVGELTTIPLQVGLLISEFFKNSFNKEIPLKWPNDLMLHGNKKIGGVICNLVEDKVIVGIGINLKNDLNYNNADFNWGSLDLNLDNAMINDTSINLYQYLLSNLSKSFNATAWNKKCSHLEKRVVIKDEFSQTTGIFTGVSNIGEAMIKISENKTVKILSGSLFIS